MAIIKPTTPQSHQHHMSSNLYRPPAITKATILLCSCGGKYIKSRAGQRSCVRCITEEKRSAGKR